MGGVGCGAPEPARGHTVVSRVWWNVLVRRSSWFLLLLAIAAIVAFFAASADPDPPAVPVDTGVVPGTDTAAAVNAPLAGAPVPQVERQQARAGADPGVERIPDAIATGYTGRVVTAAGEPVVGIDVQLLRMAADAALPVDLDLFGTVTAAPELVVAIDRTDAAGRFELLQIAPRGWCGLRLTFADLDAAPARWRVGQGTFVPVQRTPVPGEVVDLGDVRLKTGATLVGRIVGSDGPIAGALVRAARLPPLPFAAVPIERLRADGALLVTVAGQNRVVVLPPWFGRLVDLLPIAKTLSGADGTFVLYGVDPGDVVVAVTAPARASLLRQNLHCEAGAVTQLGDLQLADGSSAEVLVVDRAGAPVAGAEVIVAPWSLGVPVHIGEPAGTTDAAGKTHVDGLPRGRAVAAARLGSDATWQIGEPGPADGTLRVVVPGRHTLLLTVQDGAGKVPPDLKVRAAAGGANGGAVELALFGFGQTVDLGNRLERLDDGRLRVRDLDAGVWTFVVGAAGCATQSLEVELREDTARTVILKAARALRVRTLDVAGEPVAGATLHLSPRGGSRQERIVELPLAVGRTGADGWCSVRDLPTESARLTAIHPQHGQVHAQIDGHPAELVLQFAAPAAIRGLLTDGGRPPAPGRWVLVLERRYGDAKAAQRGAMPDLPQLTIPDLEGAFTFAALQPGRYRVTAQDAMTDIGTVAGIVQYAARREQILPWNKAEVEIASGETATVRLDAILDAPPYDGPGAVVRGVVTVNGLPAVGAVVVGTSKQPDRRITSRVDRGGVFDLGRCPQGDIRIVVVPNEVADSRLKENLFSHHYARDLQVVAEQPLDLRIDIVTGGAFGEVRDRNGAPVDDCRIVLYDRGGEGRSSALRVVRTDARGAFVCRDLPAGRYELRAEKSGQGKVTLQGLAVAGNGSDSGPFAVVLVPMVEVKGRVEVAAGARAEVRLRPTGEGEPLRTLSEPGGAFRIGDVPIGGYRAEVRVLAGAAWRPAGEVQVVEGMREVVLRVGGG